MIKAITLGGTSFPVNLIQGPLAGISSAPFRVLVSQYGKPAFTYTEMISCKTLIHQSKKTLSPFLRRLPGEGPLGVQLSGTCPQELAEAVKIATACGADLIDLNCGCPVKKIRRRGAGSALLSTPQKLHQLISAMKNNTHLPVSIKIRVDGETPDTFNHAMAKMIRESGLDFLIVHGRHWREQYETPCRYDQIRFFVDALDIPVIGNGDIVSLASLEKMFATGCAGVMLSRACVGQPWLIQQLIADAQNILTVTPSLPMIGRIFYVHVLLLARFFKNADIALLQARKFCKYYARHLPQRDLFALAVNQCADLRSLKKICLNYFCTRDV